MFQLSRLSPPVFFLLFSTVFACSTLPALAAPPVPLPDDFWATSAGYSDKVFVSADGRVVAIARYSGGAQMWTANGPTTINGLGYISGMSADGTVLVGNAGNDFVAWRADSVVTLKPLPQQPGYGAITALSADGLWAIGNLPSGRGGMYNRTPVIWNTVTGNVIDIGDTPLGTNYGWARAVSDDGSVVIGYNWTNTAEQVFRWENNVRYDLPGIYAQGMLLSGDGKVMIAAGKRWTGGAALDLAAEYVPGLASASITDLSYDGMTLVGYTYAGNLQRAFKWTDGSDAAELEALSANAGSSASAVTPDGKIAIGYSYAGDLKQHAVRWNEDGKVGSIAEMLARGGVDTDGWSLNEALSMSDDGNVIVGRGTANNNYGLWIAYCADACNILIDQNVLATSFAGLGSMGATASTYMGVETNTLGDMAAQARTGAVTGFAYGAFDSDPTTSASVGATYGLGDDLAVSGSVGIAGIETLMPYDGSANFTGPSVSIALASKPATGFNWLVGGSLVGLNGTVTRGYLNGNAPVTSTGDTSGTGASFTAEAGFAFNDLIADTLVTPFVNVTLSSVSFAGYTETGGPFPATFEPFTTNSALLRLGTEFSREFQPGSTLTAGLSYAQNFGKGGTISGSAAGIPVTVPGAAPITNFIEASIGLDMPINDQVNFSGRLAGILPLDGNAASIQARAGVTMAF